MDLREYLRVLRKGWPVVLGFLLLGTALGIFATLSTKKVYQANVQVFVATSNASSGTDLNQANTFALNQVQSYTSIATSPSVTKPVIQKLKLGITTQQLAAKIAADAPQNKVLINLHVTDHNPQAAAQLANEVAAQFDKVVEDTAKTDAGGTPVVKLTVIHPAVIPVDPIKPNKVLNIALGVVLGLLAGVALVIVRDILDNTVKEPKDFEHLNVPVLGMVPYDKHTSKTPIAFRDDPHSSRSEAYRQLRTNLQFINVDDAPRVIAVTSAVPGEGKTTTALNLAAALAEAGYRVCLIEADLRRPTLAKTLGLVAEVGFTTVLIGRSSIEQVLQNAGRNLAVLTSGPVPPNPSELLISEQAASVIKRVSEHVDYTIIDTAPLLPVADGAEVAAMADATLIVHHAGKSTRDQAARSIDALERVGERPVGVILNMMSRKAGDYGDAYGYYYVYRPDRTHRSARSTAEATAEQSATATTNGVAEHPPVAANGATGHQPVADNDVIFDIDESGVPTRRRR